MDLEKFTFINCVCCGTKIELVGLNQYDTNEEFFIDHTKSNVKYDPVSQMWKGGVVERIVSGYGSGHDGSIFYIGICDICIDVNIENARLRYAGDYMTQMNFYTESELQNFEKIRNRKTNLDDLLNKKENE